MSAATYRSLLKQYAKRKEQMCALRAQGWTLQRIGDRYGISKARVGQLVRNGART